MAEIAAELGLSRMSVSSVVNGSARRIGLSEKTIQRVREHLALRGYVPSRAARHLHGSPARVVGLIHIGSFNNHLIEAFHRLAASLAETTPGLEIMVTPRERIESAIQELRARRVTDLVWLHKSSAVEEYREERITNYLRNTRTIVYNYMFNTLPSEKELLERGIALVGVDRQAHLRRMAGFLRTLGHSVIALPDVDTSMRLYVDAFTNAGLVVAECPPPFETAKLINAMASHGVTAACFNGDNVACQAIATLRAHGVRIPEDLTVTGFDGMSREFSQNLTTLVMPVQDMVDKVCKIVSGQEQALRHCFDMELAKGETHGPPAGKSESALVDESVSECPIIQRGHNDP